jgi:hypothetical protein
MADDDFMSVEFNKLHERVQELDAVYFSAAIVPRGQLVEQLQKIDGIVQRLLGEVARHG